MEATNFAPCLSYNECTSKHSSAGGTFEERKRDAPCNMNSMRMYS